MSTEPNGVPPKTRGPAPLPRHRLTAAFALHVHTFMLSRGLRHRDLLALAFEGDDSEGLSARISHLLARGAFPLSMKHLSRVQALVFATEWKGGPADEPVGPAR